MKEFEVTVTLPADPQTALRVLYSDAAFFSAYHEKVGDAVKSVSDWDAATKTRTVCFMKRLDIPAPIARVLGARAPPAAGAAVRGKGGAQLPRRARCALLPPVARPGRSQRTRVCRAQATSRR